MQGTYPKPKDLHANTQLLQERPPDVFHNSVTASALEFVLVAAGMRWLPHDQAQGTCSIACVACL